MIVVEAPVNEVDVTGGQAVVIHPGCGPQISEEAVSEAVDDSGE